MKRIISLLLAALMVFALSGCMTTHDEVPGVTVGVVTQAPQGGKSSAEAPPATQAQSETQSTPQTEAAPETQQPSADDKLDPDGWYDSKDEVALYLLQYGHLPDNYITKKEAEKLGWPGGSLEPYAPGKSIGGSYFGNYEGLLPAKEGREYHECDIDTAGKKSRGAKRIVWSNDGLIYYTDDHYESFTLLYGEVDG